MDNCRQFGRLIEDAAGQKADLVIGQVDFNRSWVNYPSGDAQVPTDSGLLRPVGLVVDVDGNLLVADSGNGRVLRFPAPFAQSQGVLQHANLVLGQSSFTTQIKDASSQNMNTPFGLALFSDGSLAVSDSVHNRVLVFRRTATTDFTNGQAAADFITWLTSSDTQKTYVDKGGIPARKSILNDAALNQKNPYFSALAKSLDAVPNWRPRTDQWNAVETILGTNLNAALAGTATPEAAVQKAADAIRTLMKGAGY